MRAILGMVLVTALFAILPTPTPAQQSGQLSLKNARMVYGRFGQDRKESKLLVGDVFWLAYDIEGLQVKEDGVVLYTVGMELVNKEGKSIFKQSPTDQTAINSLGTGRKVAYAYLEIGTDTVPGEYTLTVTVADRLSKATQSLPFKFEVLKKRLGFVQVGLTQAEFRPTPPVAVPGQEFWINFAVTGFALSEKKQPNLSIEMQVFDLATKQPTLTKPILGEIKEVEEKFKEFIPWSHPMFLNRPGKYRVRVTATDNNAAKAVQSIEMDFEVLATK